MFLLMFYVIIYVHKMCYTLRLSLLSVSHRGRLESHLKKLVYVPYRGH